MRPDTIDWRRWGAGVVILFGVGFLAYAIIAAGMASWMVAEKRPEAALFWMPHSPAGLVQRAEALAANGKQAEAQSIARAAVAQSPLTSAPLYTLAMATGDLEKRRRVMRQAGRLDLHDQFAQYWLMNDAAASGDVDSVAFSADMLLRRRVGVNQTAILLQLSQLLASDSGRKAVAARLRLAPKWRSDFLRSAGRNGVPDQFGALLLELKGPFEKYDLNGFFYRLVSTGRYAEAHRYWQPLFGGSAEGLVYDSQFDGLPGPWPLNWGMHSFDAGRGTLGPEEGAPAGKLRLNYDGIGASSALANQVVLLPPGRYRIEVRLNAMDPEAAGRFRVEVDCYQGAHILDLPLRKPDATAQADFVVPSDCQAQDISFWPIAGERRQELELLVESLIVRPVT